MSLYVVSVPGFAKVGYAHNLADRLRQYQGSNPLIEKFDATFEGNEADEKKIHAILEKRFRRKGRTEWFVGATAEDAIACVRQRQAEVEEHRQVRDRARVRRRLSGRSRGVVLDLEGLRRELLDDDLRPSESTGSFACGSMRLRRRAA